MKATKLPIPTIFAQATAEKAYLEEEVRTEHQFGDIVGESPALRAALRAVETVAPTDATVLVRGAIA